MSEGSISIKKAIPIIVVTWILSLVTTLALVYFAPFVPIGTNQISDSSVTSDKIADGAIITTTLADDSVTSAKIVDGSIVAQDIADGSIITIKVVDGAITTAKVADSAITTPKIANSAIVAVKLANDSVTTEKIAEGNVTTALLADGAVTTTKLADNAIIAIKLADGAVTSAKILDATITAADLAQNSVTSVQIANDTITTADIGDYQVTSNKLASMAIPMWSKLDPGFFNFNGTAWTADTAISSTITLDRTSNLLILFSAQGWLSAVGDWAVIHVWVGGTEAYPRGVDEPVLLSSATVGSFQSDSDTTTRVFHLLGVGAGTYLVQVEYRMFSGVTDAYVADRTLSVIALPA